MYENFTSDNCKINWFFSQIKMSCDLNKVILSDDGIFIRLAACVQRPISVNKASFNEFFLLANSKFKFLSLECSLTEPLFNISPQVKCFNTNYMKNETATSMSFFLIFFFR